MFSKKQSLSTILSVFGKVKQDLINFISENKNEMKEMEESLKVMGADQAQAETALNALKALTGETK